MKQKMEQGGLVKVTMLAQLARFARSASPLRGEVKQVRGKLESKQMRYKRATRSDRETH